MDLGRHQHARTRAHQGDLRWAYPGSSDGASVGDPAGDIKRSATVRALLPLAAELLGFAVPEQAVELVDKGAINYDADGNPLNLPDLLEDLLQSDPSLSKWYRG